MSLKSIYKISEEETAIQIKSRRIPIDKKIVLSKYQEYKTLCNNMNSIVDNAIKTQTANNSVDHIMLTNLINNMEGSNKILKILMENMKGVLA